MEILFSQRHNLATITPMKDYCPIDGMIEYDANDPWNNVTQIINQNIVTLPAKLQKGKRRLRYYYNSEPLDEKISLYSRTSSNKSFHTD
jgi:hypothetical protein